MRESDRFDPEPSGQLDGFDPDAPGAAEIMGGPLDGVVLSWDTPTPLEEPWIAVAGGSEGEDRLVVFSAALYKDGRFAGTSYGMAALVEGEEKAWPRRVYVPGTGWVAEEGT